MNEATQKSICLTPNCGHKVQYRGICNRCNQALNRAIKAGELTANEAIEFRLILPKSTGRDADTPFKLALEKALAERNAKKGGAA